MISIRENVFESNSSSMHCLTVCASPGNEATKDYVKNQLKRWKKEDETYEVNITLDDDQLDKDDFTIRRYIPHNSINDKLMYMLATVIQHFNGQLLKGPIAPNPKEESWNTHFKENMLDYEKGYKEWEDKGYRPANQFWIKRFKGAIEELEKDLAYKFSFYLSERDTERPKVTVKLNYYIDEASDTILGSPITENKWFGTGCYGNEEFYYAACYTSWRAASWICNPFNQILAGSDEQDDEENIAQETKARDLIEESWQLYKDSRDTDEDECPILNPGKTIWPIGG